MLTANPVHKLYHDFLAAETAWEIEMRKVTTDRIGDFRYTRTASGAPGTALRSAYDAFRQAGDTWRTAAR